MKRLVSIFIILLMSVGITGCSSGGVNKYRQMPLVKGLSEKELIDYYKKSLSYDTIISKNINVDEISYERIEVSDETKSMLSGLLRETEEILKGSTYKENSNLITEETFGYIKGFLNDKAIYNGNIVDVYQALGFYFIDVEYDIKKGSIGTLKPEAMLIGIHGAYETDIYGNESINEAFLNKAVQDINRYYEQNGIESKLYFDARTKTIVERENIDSNTIPNVSVIEESSEETEEIDETVEDEVIVTPDISNNMKVSTITPQEFNSIAGSSVGQSAFMPELTSVYNIPKDSEVISGIGIYPGGNGGLYKFGFNSSELKGKMVLRYIFKDDVKYEGNIVGTNIYPISYDIETGIGVNISNTEVPNFLLEELNKLVERADRSLMNNDLTALTSENVFKGREIGVLSGYINKSTNILKNTSDVKRVIQRELSDNTYMIEVETLRQEGSKSSDTFGTYQDKYYMVVEQIDTKFVISDYMLMSRNMIKEPSIQPDTSILKRLIALNLTGEIPEKSKTEIEGLLDELYTASTYRYLRGGREIEKDGEKVYIERGMYDCFNSDTTMLSESDKEYMNSYLRDLLIKHGTNVDAEYNGVVTEWIGGTDRQAEFYTEELISYSGKNVGMYLQTYYLVSSMNDKWVIDEMRIVEEYEVSSDEMSNILSRING